jgi:hypothetical protein
MDHVCGRGRPHDSRAGARRYVWHWRHDAELELEVSMSAGIGGTKANHVQQLCQRCDEL